MIPKYLSAIWSAMAPGLGNHLWQSTFFAVIAGLLTLLLRKNQARTRYWLWLAASAKFLIPFSFLAGVGSHIAWSRHSAATNAGLYFAMEEVSPLRIQQRPCFLELLPRQSPQVHFICFRHFLRWCGSVASWRSFSYGACVGSGLARLCGKR